MNVFFRGISFAWALGAMAVFACVYALWAYVSYRRLKADATADWDYMVANNMQDLRLTKDVYVQTYCRVNAPRSSVYLAGGALLILILTPVALGLINFSLWALWELNDQSRVFEPGYLVWEFSIFFMVIGTWVGIGTLVSRRYYAREPGLMRDELIQARLDFTPTQPLVVGANPVHIQAERAAGEAGISRRVYKSVFEDALGLVFSQDKNWNGTGQICDIYTDGSGMNICVHSPTKDGEICGDSHPFFFERKHPREDITDVPYSIIMKLEDVHTAYEKITALGLPMDKITGNPRSTMRSFRHVGVSVYLYQQ